MIEIGSLPYFKLGERHAAPLLIDRTGRKDAGPELVVPGAGTVVARHLLERIGTTLLVDTEMRDSNHAPDAVHDGLHDKTGAAAVDADFAFGDMDDTRTTAAFGLLFAQWHKGLRGPVTVRVGDHARQERLPVDHFNSGFEPVRVTQANHDTGLIELADRSELECCCDSAVLVAGHGAVEKGGVVLDEHGLVVRFAPEIPLWGWFDLQVVRAVIDLDDFPR